MYINKKITIYNEPIFFKYCLFSQKKCITAVLCKKNIIFKFGHKKKRYVDQICKRNKLGHEGSRLFHIILKIHLWKDLSRFGKFDNVRKLHHTLVLSQSNKFDAFHIFLLTPMLFQQVPIPFQSTFSWNLGLS
jgi:hypothetical protein